MFELGFFYAFKIRTYLVIQLLFLYISFCNLQLTEFIITTEGKRLIKIVLCSGKDTKYFKSKLLMAISSNFVHFKLSYFCNTEVSCSSDCYQQSGCAWEGTCIGLMITSQLPLADDENWKLAVPVAQRHFASDLPQKILSIFLVFLWFTRQYDLVPLFLQVAFPSTWIHLFIWFCNFWSSSKTVP